MCAWDGCICGGGSNAMKYVWLGWVCWLWREQCDEMCAWDGCVGGVGSNTMKYVPEVGVLVGEGAMQ